MTACSYPPHPPKVTSRRRVVRGKIMDRRSIAESLTLGEVLGQPWRDARPMLRRRRRKGCESARHQRIAKKAARRA